jgi:Na+/proline symporter
VKHSVDGSEINAADSSYAELKKIKERTARNEKKAKWLNRASIIIASLAVLLTIIACLDKIILLASYVLSCLH